MEKNTDVKTASAFSIKKLFRKNKTKTKPEGDLYTHLLSETEQMPIEPKVEPVSPVVQEPEIKQQNKVTLNQNQETKIEIKPQENLSTPVAEERESRKSGFFVDLVNKTSVFVDKINEPYRKTKEEREKAENGELSYGSVKNGFMKEMSYRMSNKGLKEQAQILINKPMPRLNLSPTGIGLIDTILLPFLLANFCIRGGIAITQKIISATILFAFREKIKRGEELEELKTKRRNRLKAYGLIKDKENEVQNSGTYADLPENVNVKQKEIELENVNVKQKEVNKIKDSELPQEIPDVSEFRKNAAQMALKVLVAKSIKDRLNDPIQSVSSRNREQSGIVRD